MKNLLLLTSLLIVGCSNQSAYRAAVESLEDVELAEKVWLTGVDWYPVEAPEGYKITQLDLEKSKDELHNCEASLVSKNNQNVGLFPPKTKSIVFATVKIIECMRNKGWRARVSSGLLTV